MVRKNPLDIVNSPITFITIALALYLSIRLVQQGISEILPVVLLGIVGPLIFVIFFLLVNERGITRETGYFFRSDVYNSAMLFCIGFTPFLILELVANMSLFVPQSTISGGALTVLSATSSTPVAQSLIVGHLAPFLEEMWRLSGALIGLVIAYMLGIRDKTIYILFAALTGASVFAMFHPIQAQLMAFVFGIVVTTIVVTLKAYEFGLGAHFGWNLGYLGLVTMATAWFTTLWGFLVMLLVASQYLLAFYGVYKGKVSFKTIFGGGE